MNMDICVVGTLNQLCITDLKLKQNFQKNKAVTGKTPFFVIGPFFTQHSICLKLTLASDMTVLHENDAFLIVIL